MFYIKQYKKNIKTKKISKNIYIKKNYFAIKMKVIVFIVAFLAIVSASKYTEFA